MTDTIDKLAMYVSGGLLLLATVGTGLVELLAGKPYSPVSMEGKILEGAAVHPNIRTALVVAGLLVLLVYAGYKLATPLDEGSERTTAASSTSD
jgi:hypothetical protein